MADYKFQCKFCGARFKQEVRYERHECKEMRRDEEIRTPQGQTAWNYYRLWMTVQRRNVPTLETFLSSKYFTTFMKFSEFVGKVGIPNVEQYIKFMIRQENHPTIWMNDMIYSNYLHYLDKGRDPLKQAEHTIDVLFKVSEKLECDVSEVFDKAQPHDIIHLLQRRQLTPWILLHSDKFKQFYSKQVTKEQQLAIATLIKRDVWAKRRNDEPDTVNVMKKIVRELNL